MLFTLTCTGPHAPRLPELFNRNPQELHTVTLSAGRVHLFFPELTSERVTAAFLLDLEPAGVERRPRGGMHAPKLVADILHDRAYISSATLISALGPLLEPILEPCGKTARAGCQQSLPLEAHLHAVTCRRGGVALLQRLFVPLGFELHAEPLVPMAQQGGGSYVWQLVLKRECPLQVFLRHLYLLTAVMDDDAPEWEREDEAERLLTLGETWLSDHPEQAWILERGRSIRRRLLHPGLEPLLSMAGERPVDRLRALEPGLEARLEAGLNLVSRRLQAVVRVLEQQRISRVGDLGCGEGRLLKELLARPQFKRIVGLDVAVECLERASRRLRLDQLPEAQADRVQLLHGSVLYYDKRLEGLEALTLLEVLEHIDPEKLPLVEEVLFEGLRPPLVIVTTPNQSFNGRLEGLLAGQLRHSDHRFEWTREQARRWAEGVSYRHSYRFQLEELGERDLEVGAPTVMVIFQRH